MSPRFAYAVRIFGVLLLIMVASLPAAENQASARRFEVTYQVTVPALAAENGPLHLWIPLPPSDAYQDISELKIESPVRYKLERESEYGNRLAYFEVNPQRVKTPFEVVLRFHTTRREHRVTLTPVAANAAPHESRAVLARFLQRDKLVPLDGAIAELSHQQTEGVTDPQQKARKIYDYVVATMRYDKSGQGWGRGDAIWACTAKRGNCTDFHSLFIGMMRVAGIPSRFEIGFPLPADKTEGDISGYHCWAEFYLNGVGWVPVDASEAWKNPAKRDYFFGAHDVNRVRFTDGRDIRLDAHQKGDPLNYFIYPYAELQGKRFDGLKSHFAFRDLPPAVPGADKVRTTAGR